MNLRYNAILIVSGLVAGIVLALLVQPAITMPPARSGTASVIPATGDSNVPSALAGAGLQKFSSPAEISPFLEAHTDAKGNYPALQAVEPVAPEIPAAVPGNGTRTWSFDVDTSTFRPDEYIVTATAVLYDATGTALFNVLDPQAVSSPPVRPTGQTPSGNAGPIRIDSVGDRFIGEKFTITGTTNLPKDAQILVEIYSSSFRPTQKSQSGEFSGATGTIRVSGTGPVSPAPGLTGSNAHSDTNVQVSGVDEADIIKTDGNYLYVVSKNTLRILRAYPPATAGIVATQAFSGTPLALYVTGDRLTLITVENRPSDTWSCGTGTCRAGSTEESTKIFIFSVSDPAKPAMVRELGVDGRYRDSRMIGRELYFLTTRFTGSDPGTPGFPEIRDSAKGSSVLPLYYFDRNDRAFSETVLGSVDVGTTGNVNAQAFLIGSAGTVYVSPDHLDIAISSYGNPGTGGSTGIYSFGIRDGRISYEAQGTVDGTLLNQFSLDEYDGNLRVATTVQDGNRQGSTTYNKVTVLDRHMELIGAVGDIAPTEKIYAARFLGNRLYLVTFRQTDPFFVIDLSDPQHPRTLGELKIPGFSDYLEPYDDARIIGIGKESASGSLKMALIDVSDVRHPVLVAEEKMGDAGSDSEVLRDHRALLFDKDKNLFVLPVTLAISPVYRPDRPAQSSAPTSWGGAYVYTVDPAHGFTLKGTVEHYAGTGGENAPVQRALYIENTLYTMSADTIVMSDLDNRVHRIGSIALA